MALSRQVNGCERGIHGKTQETAFHTENNDHKTPERVSNLVCPRNSKHFYVNVGSRNDGGREKVTIKSYRVFCSVAMSFGFTTRAIESHGRLWTAVTKSCQLLCRWTEETTG